MRHINFRNAAYDVSNILRRKYIYGPSVDEPIAMIEAAGTYAGAYCYHFDGLGSVVALTDESGDAAIAAITAKAVGSIKPVAKWYSTGAADDAAWRELSLINKVYYKIGQKTQSALKYPKYGSSGERHSIS